MSLLGFKMIQTKRVYEPYDKSDGVRLFVDKLYPRGIKKENLHFDQWLKDIAPSNQLRHWFNHDPAKWEEFKKRYWVELKEHKNTLDSILQSSKEKTVTLLYSAHDTEHNNAVALKEYLERYAKDT